MPNLLSNNNYFQSIRDNETLYSNELHKTMQPMFNELNQSINSNKKRKKKKKTKKKTEKLSSKKNETKKKTK